MGILTQTSQRDGATIPNFLHHNDIHIADTIGVDLGQTRFEFLPYCQILRTNVTEVKRIIDKIMVIKMDSPSDSMIDDNAFRVLLTLKEPFRPGGVMPQELERKLQTAQNRTPAKQRTTMWQSGLAEAVMNNMLQISMHPKRLFDSFEAFIKNTKIDTAPRRARPRTKGYTTSAPEARRNFLWAMAVDRFVKIVSDNEGRDLLTRFKLRGTEYYDERAVRYSEISNTMTVLSEHYKGLLAQAKASACDEYGNNELPSEAEEEMARYLYHEAMMADGKAEKDRFMVETDILPANTNGFLQKCVALYRIANGWHSILVVHIDDIWPTVGHRQTMLSQMEYDHAMESIGNMPTEKIMPHLIKVIQTTQWIIEACWTSGQINIFAEIMHSSDVSSAHLRIQGRDVPEADEYELPGTSIGRRRGVRYTDTAGIDSDVVMQDPASRDVGWPSNTTQSSNITGNGNPQTETNICRIRLERRSTVTYMCGDGVPNPESWPRTEIRCSARDGTETKVLWVNPETNTQYMSRALRFGDVVP